MSRWFERMSEVLERHGGTVEKFIGDAVMAVFGIPELHEDDALRAVRAATELRQALAELNDELERELGVRIGIRVGVNTGEVVAGDGTGGQMLVTGDPVNVAKRLEEAARTGEILVGERYAQARRERRRARAARRADGERQDRPGHRLERPRRDRGRARLRAAARRAARRPRATSCSGSRAAYASAVADERAGSSPIVGPAGIGKSRLAAELCRSVRDEATMLTGRCLPYGDGITFWPLVEIVRRPRRRRRRTRRPRATPTTQRSSRSASSAPSATHSAAPGGELFWAVRRLFEELARDRPLIVMVEDIHWAAPTLLDLLEYLAGWTHDAPVLLLCLARPDLLEERQGWLTATNATGVVSRAAHRCGSRTHCSTRSLRSGRSTPKRDSRSRQPAEGNPLYVEQMAAMLAEGEPADTIPPSIQALLGSASRPPARDERAVLERAAVAGKEFVRVRASQLSEEPSQSRWTRGCSASSRKDLLAATPGPRGCVPLPSRR